MEERLEHERALRKQTEEQLERLMSAQEQSRPVTRDAPAELSNETSLGALLRNAPPVEQGITRGSGGLVPEASSAEPSPKFAHKKLQKEM